MRGSIKQNEPALTEILREYDIDNSSSVAKKLLESRFFDPTLKGKIQFPELFDVLPTQSAEREASKPEAVRDEASTVREISDRKASRDSAIISHTGLQGERTFSSDQSIYAAYPEQDAGTVAVRSLYPVYIHYRCRHLVLTTIQELLKESCFEFAQHHFTQLLAKNGWDCPEAVELTEWTKILSHKSNPLINTLETPLMNLLAFSENSGTLLCTGFEKVQLVSSDLLRMRSFFFGSLGDSTRSDEVESLWRELQSAIEEFKRSKDLFERRLLA
ncbi:unnamed protein product [Penicillium salamii]|uniref:Uncharacterized protein n=1 Tax=Penicillium salamii TaxID=1612424 RepID=A0A9W4IDE4_9EURO|nr:unnamed protein product [Penicillium salamii]